MNLLCSLHYTQSRLYFPILVFYPILNIEWTRLISERYIRGLTNQLREFIRHCPECHVLQTRRHQPYGSLSPIESPPVPFHTLTLDFILALPGSPEGFDTILSVTDKFTKRITCIPGKNTWSAERWAEALLDRLEVADWGIPKAMISDRDRKFLGELWRALFKRLDVALLYSTAYHPQTDGSSERTNQTVEIAMRFYVNTLREKSSWPKILPRIQALLNNSSSSTTGHTPNELAYGFTPNTALDLLVPAPGKALGFLIARDAAKDAIDFANINSKHHYDRNHQPMFLKVGDLHTRYVWLLQLCSAVRSCRFFSFHHHTVCAVSLFSTMT